MQAGSDVLVEVFAKTWIDIFLNICIGLNWAVFVDIVQRFRGIVFHPIHSTCYDWLNASYRLIGCVGDVSCLLGVVLEQPLM